MDPMQWATYSEPRRPSDWVNSKWLWTDFIIMMENGKKCSVYKFYYKQLNTMAQ